MINATLYKELSDASDIVEIQSGVTLAESFQGVDLSRMVIIVNGRESDKSHIVREGDVIILRSIPHALTTAALITLGVIVLGGAVYFGIEAYKARKQAEELEEKLKNLNDSVKNVPYLQRASNSIALGKSQPYLIGEHLFTPYLMTGTFSKLSGTDGADQYFYAVLENGFNSQVLRRLYCDDVSLKDWGDALTVPQEGIYAFDATSVFHDANSLIEVAQDGNAFATVLFDKKISTESPGSQLKKADDDDYEDLVYTLPRYTRASEVCIMINGLRAYDDSGSKINRTITVIPEYQLVDGGAWTAFTFDQNGTPSNTFTRNIMTQLRFVARIDFTYAAVASLTDPVKVRLRCTTNAYDGSASDDVYVQWIQSEIYDPIASATASAFVDEKIIGDTERALSTLIGLKIKVTTSNEDKLSKINCVSAGVARTWSGTAWSVAKTPTSNPAAWLLEVLTSPTHLASQCDDSEIDLDSFGELYEYCATNSLAVDMVLADGDTKESIITTILQTCFSMLYRDIYGKISVAIDEAKPNAIALFNTQNVTSFENEKALARRADGIKVSYVSRDGGYVQSSHLIMRSGVTRSSDSIIRDVSVTGIVEYNHIVKYARRLMAIEALRPKTTTIGVGREGTYFTPLSKVLIQHPSLRVGLGSAEIKSVIDNGTHITGLVLYEPVTYDADDVNGYGVVIGCVGDDYYTPVAAAYTADSERPTEIEFVTPIILSAAAIPHPGDVLSYGTLVGGLFDLITTPMLISGISPTDEGFAITLMDYDEDVYAVGDIPDYVPNFAGLKPTVSVPATVPPASQDSVAEAIANTGIRLELSAISLRRDRAEVVAPATITASTYRPGSTYLGRFTIELSHDGITYQDPVYTSSSDESSYEYTAPATMDITGTAYYVASIRFRLYASGGMTTRIGEALSAITPDSSAAPIYWGRLSTPPAAGYLPGDYYLDDRAPVIVGSAEGGVLRVWNGTAWIEYLSSAFGYTDAMKKAELDLLAWGAEYGQTTLAAAVAIINSLWAYDALVGRSLRAGARYGIDGSVEDAAEAGIYIGHDGTFKAGASGGEFSVDPATGKVSIEGLDLELSSSDLTAYYGIGDDRIAARLTEGELQLLKTPAGGTETKIAGVRTSGENPILDGEFKAECDNASLNQIYSIPTVTSWASVSKPLLVKTPGGKRVIVFVHGRTNGFTVCTRGVDFDDYGTAALGDITVYGSPSVAIDDDGYIRVTVIKVSVLEALEYVFSMSETGALSTVSGPTTLFTNCIYAPYHRNELNELVVVGEDATTHYLGASALRSGSWVNVSSLYTGFLAQYPEINVEYDGKLRIYYRDTTVADTVYTREMGITGFGSPSTFAVTGFARLDYCRIALKDDYLYITTSSTTIAVYKKISSVWTLKRQITTSNYMRAGTDGDTGTYFVLSFGSSILRNIYQNDGYSRVGAGIIESGSNSNGSWVKYGDGTMEQWGATAIDCATLQNTAIGTYGWSYYYGSTALPFPKQFHSADSLLVSNGSGIGARYSSVTTSGFTAYAINDAPVNPAYVSWLAKGRWKALS